MSRSHWESALASAVPSLECVSHVRVLDEVVSTQDVAAEASQRCEPGWLVVADRQTGGRGRRGSIWHQTSDGHGLGVALSITLPVVCAHSTKIPDPSLILACETPPGIVACAGLAVVNAAATRFPALKGRIGVKWPNDVVERATGRKCAGCLVEQHGDVLILGVGLNVHQQTQDFAETIRDRATSLEMLTGSLSENEDIRLGILCDWLRSFDMLRNCSVANIKEQWQRNDATAHRVCTVVSGNTTVRGTICATDPWDGICIDTEERVEYVNAATARVTQVDGWCELG
ncbi:MAG: biotin--[acetyl-CoA-carboxylase] ligase [Phycisphaeraceae bacterium]|nr:biotin--[acetyl-CoA-carboxylase] ligase [Phycisphaerales bacterium]MCB9861525.1 biotin--[acetyl-CoA-carboxylase] ligase [Phycisphaeraceae bacterium]